MAKNSREMIILCWRFKCRGAVCFGERNRRRRTNDGEVWDKIACQPRKWNNKMRERKKSNRRVSKWKT